MLHLDTGPLDPGGYVLTVEYSNQEYTGPASAPIGELHHTEDLHLTVS